MKVYLINQRKRSALLISSFGLLMLLFAAGCSEKEDTTPEAGVTFNAIIMESNGEGEEQQPQINSVIISITDASDNLVHENLEIYREPSNGNGVAFEPLSLEPGTYYVTDFIVLNEQKDTLFIAPKRGSIRSSLVDSPLKKEFTVVENSTVAVSIEVLFYNANDSPDNYGYGGIQISIIDTFNFQISVFIFDTENSQTRLIPAHLKVSVDDTERVNRTLDAGTNVVEVNDHGSTYLLTVTAEGNIDPVIREYDLNELKQYAPGSGNPPLTIVMQYHINVQDRLNQGESPKQLFDLGVPLDSIIGKSYQGGLIFYLNTTHGNGYVVYDQELPFTPWGCQVLINGTSRSFGMGKANTNILRDVANNDSACNGNVGMVNGYAGYDDWFLPSVEELLEIYDVLRVPGLEAFVNGYYWSSVPNYVNGHYTAKAIHFGNRGEVNLTRESNAYVRPVREFIP